MTARIEPMTAEEIDQEQQTARKTKGQVKRDRKALAKAAREGSEDSRYQDGPRRRRYS